MQITNLKSIKSQERVGVAATVIWEDCDQPQKDIYIETEAPFTADISCNPHAFLVGCLIPAMHFGERRIVLEQEVCPGLKEGLETIMSLMKEWSAGQLLPLSLEMKTSSSVQYTEKQRHAGLFLSGGIDSLAALRAITLNYPSMHPGAIKDCLFVHGFDIGGVVQRGMKYHVFERAKAAMTRVTEDANINLIPIYTNIRHLCDERELWLEKFFGAVLASVAHAFASRLELVYIASSFDIPNLTPCGSHPMLDPEYSSFDMRIRLRDLSLSRMDKLRIVAGWDVALNNIRVCLANVQHRMNCGKCEKCVRTMLGLLAIGALDKTEAFVENDVSPDLLSAFSITIRHREPFYRELLEPLKSQGKDDLVEVIKSRLSKNNLS
ncbi:MAG: hypothetical protein HKO79_01745 [Desulfobacterales bacterium]|nr:hypothetical protein [Deltaproteobacteria bacterium]MBT8373820.1 hypothetical protein [Deltaproteobacteria bacterium]NNL41197.1 hypothetical protein [Desulfobacterales bacterium]